MSFSDHDVDQSDRRAAEQSRKPKLMSFPSLEHLDRMSDGSPWRSTTRRRRKFRGGIGGLHRRRGEVTDPTRDDDDDDDIELDRVDDLEAVPDTSRRPAKTTTSISRTASAAAKQREKQALANRGTRTATEPENRIYRPVTKAQPLPPQPLAPRPPAPINRDELRVVAKPNSSTEGETIETSASRPRQQRRRRPRVDGDTVSQKSSETQAVAPAGSHELHVHRPQNGSSNVSRDMSTETTVKPEPEVGRRGHRHSSRRTADSRGTRQTETKTETFV